MHSKRGELLENGVLEIVIAVACVIILIFLGIKVATILQGKNKVEQAKVSLGDIKSIISSLDVGKSKEYILLTPSKSIVMAFNDPQGLSGCVIGKPCICICEFGSSCKEKVYYCTPSERIEISSISNLLLPPVKISIKREPGRFLITEVKE